MTEKKRVANTVKEKNIEELECFVIMPIGNNTEYEEGHFKSVYDDIFKKAIEDAGFVPYRADDSQSSSVIHLEIIKRLIDAPMAICDLSSKNPNVMYELGIRQAFDKPVVLVGDNNPGEIFDIGNINTYQYRKSLIYREVLEDQETITKMLKETYKQYKNGSSYNSLISLIKMTAATINTSVGLNDSDMMKMIYNEIVNMKTDINRIKIDRIKTNDNLFNNYEKIKLVNGKFNNIKNELNFDGDKKISDINSILVECDNILRSNRLNLKEMMEITEIQEKALEYRKKLESDLLNGEILF